MKREIISCCILLGCSLGLAAQPNVNFNHLTGTANVTIPLYKVGGIPVRLNYSARGIKAKDVAGMVGLGWNLNAGGGIYREVKDLADDVPGGWLNSNVGELIENFSESQNINCEDESDEFDQLDAIYSEQDTEPDIFYINTPLISGKFMFDNNKIIQVQPYQDLLIEYVALQDSVISYKSITSFTITDEFGVKYEFSVTEKSSRYPVFEQPDAFFQRMQGLGYKWSVTDAWLLSKVIMPNGSYVKFNYKSVVLTNQVKSKSYEDDVARNFMYKGSSVNAFGRVYKPTESHVLESIATSEGEEVRFVTSTRNNEIIENRLSKVELYRNLTLVSTYQFYYKDVFPNNFQGWSPSIKEQDYERHTFLKAVYPVYNDEVHEGYTFDYYGVYDYYNKLPSYKSSAVDIYGYYKQNGVDDAPNAVIYYNPALDVGSQFRTEALPEGHPDKGTEVPQVRELFPTIYYYPALDSVNQYRIEPLPVGHPAKGSEIVLDENDRSVDTTGLAYGSLSKLTYPTGGLTRFYYEANTYYDAIADTTYYGPGIRLKKTIVHDGVSNANNMVTNYSYDNGSGSTSGVIISRPAYAFSTSYSYGSEVPLTYDEILALSAQRQAEELSIRTNFNMSSGSSTVLYKRVGVAQPGSGKTIFNFELPAVAGDITANNGEWSPTKIKMARTTPSPSQCYELGRFMAGINVYPFPDNPNYDFQRGLLTTVEAYDEDDNPVSQTAYEYTRTNPDNLTATIYGMRIEKVPSYQPNVGIPADPSSEYFYSYGRYNAFVNTRNSVSKVTKTLYDPQDPTKWIDTETDYTYNAANKRLSESTVTNSDGTIAKRYTKYVADYSVGTPAADLETEMLDSLQKKHRNAIIIEDYATTTIPGGVEKLVSGTVTTFNDFDEIVVHPYHQYAIDKTAIITQSAFAPSSVSNGTFIMDPNYEQVKTISEYDLNGKASSTINVRSRVLSGVHRGNLQNASLAEITNAGAANFLYSGFEEDSEYDFEQDPDALGAGIYGTGKTGLKSLQLKPGSATSLFGIIEKRTQSQKLVLSFWLSAPVAGNITFEFTNEDGSSTYVTGTVNFDASTDWIYYETIVNASSLPTTTWVSLSTSAEVYIDDILLYPNEATVLYRSFGVKGELLSESIASQTTTYYEYDDQLRNTLIRDDDKNIVSKTDYTDVEIDPPLNPFFRYRGLNQNGEAVFELDDPTSANDSYTWFFNGSESGVGISMPAGESTYAIGYSEDGIYDVRLEVTDGSEISSSEQTIKVERDAIVQICGAGPRIIDKCDYVAEAIFEDGCLNTTGYQIASSVFRIANLYNCTDCENLSTYSWEVSFDDAHSWQQVGTDESVSLFYTDSFVVRCVVTIAAPVSQTIISNYKTVVLYKSDPLCPDNYLAP